MRVVYAGGPMCSEATFKRLLVLANEIGFSDRPSLTFSGWGTVGMRSPLRGLEPGIQNGPVGFLFHEPPPRVTAVYSPLVARDVEDLTVRHVVLDGLLHDPMFRDRMIAADARYGKYSGAEVLAALAADAGLLGADLGNVDGLGQAFDISSEQGRRDTLRLLLMDASIHVTSAMLATAELDVVPVADSPALARLISLRLGATRAGSTLFTTSLGFEIVRAVVPDEALAKLAITDVLDFRRKTADVYVAWASDLDRLSGMIDDVPVGEDLAARVRKMVATEVKPKMDVYRAEMTSARDAIFGDLIKSVLDWKLPTLAISLLHHDPLLAAALAGIGNLAQAVVKTATDQTVLRRGIARRHGVAYLVQLVDRTNAA